MTRPYQLPVSRPPYPWFEDDPRAEMEEERAAFADWRRDNPYERASDTDDECEIVARPVRLVRL